MECSRSESGTDGLTRITPQLTYTQSAPSPSMTPYPVTRDPLSIPSTRMGSGGGAGQLVFLDIEVCVNVLNVVVLFHQLHQFHDRLRRLPFQLDLRLRNHGDFRRHGFN